MSEKMREIMLNYIANTKGISIKEIEHMTNGDIEECLLSNKREM
ncbi:hypothetical protein RJD24_08245 [Bacillaceae bacterium IKA-2]|nr:hypothetical protein RJD24_08245 [Bacillaceae bacterium IKA-2]